MFETGQRIYGIEIKEDRYDEAEISGYLFMAECEDYTICCSEYSHCKGNFESQLQEMAEESMNDCSVEVNILKKDLCFETLKQAEDHVDKLRKQS